MKAYLQAVLSAPRKKAVMIKKGRKMVQMTYTTKSGQMKNKYEPNSSARVVKFIKHSPR